MLRGRLDRGSGAVVSHIDISTRRKLELATEAARATLAEKYGVLFEASRDGLVVLEAERPTILEANEAFAQLVGRPRQTLHGSDAQRLFPESTAQQVLERIGTQLANPAHGPLSVTLRSASGSIDAELVASPLNTPDQKCVLWVVRDVSSRLAMEREQQRMTAASLEGPKLEVLGQLAAGMAPAHGRVRFRRDARELQSHAPAGAAAVWAWHRARIGARSAGRAGA